MISEGLDIVQDIIDDDAGYFEVLERSHGSPATRDRASFRIVCPSLNCQRVAYVHSSKCLGVRRVAYVYSSKCSGVQA